MSATETRCYATRLLNPFQGVAQIVSTEQARAISVARQDRLPAESYPVCRLDEHWHTPQAAQPVSDYLNWQACLLLTLPLPNRRRRELEIQAQKRPLSVHRYHRLYPAVVDESLLKKILVEAVMRNAADNP